MLKRYFCLSRAHSLKYEFSNYFMLLFRSVFPALLAPVICLRPSTHISSWTCFNGRLINKFKSSHWFYSNDRDSNLSLNPYLICIFAVIDFGAHFFPNELNYQRRPTS